MTDAPREKHQWRNRKLKKITSKMINSIDLLFLDGCISQIVIFFAFLSAVICSIIIINWSFHSSLKCKCCALLSIQSYESKIWVFDSFTAVSRHKYPWKFNARIHAMVTRREIKFLWFTRALRSRSQSLVIWIYDIRVPFILMDVTLCQHLNQWNHDLYLDI